MGNVIDKEGIRTDPEKIQAITIWNLPNCLKEWQSFLGFCNYYRRFIKSYAALSEPLSSMARKGTKFVWDDERIVAFTKLNDKLSMLPIMSPIPQRENDQMADSTEDSTVLPIVSKKRYPPRNTDNPKPRYRLFTKKGDVICVLI